MCVCVFGGGGGGDAFVIFEKRGRGQPRLSFSLVRASYVLVTFFLFSFTSSLLFLYRPFTLTLVPLLITTGTLPNKLTVIWAGGGEGRHIDSLIFNQISISFRVSIYLYFSNMSLFLSVYLSNHPGIFIPACLSLYFSYLSIYRPGRLIYISLYPSM